MVVARPAFAGFPREGIQFLADLAEHNDRAWFQPRKADYERLIKEPLEALVAALAERFAARDIPLLADPKRWRFLPDQVQAWHGGCGYEHQPCAPHFQMRYL
jgi:uncharacterized protein (DUF2461 family)